MFSHTCPIFLHNYINTMAKITYITHNDEKHTVEVQNGLQTMTTGSLTKLPTETSRVCFPTCDPKKG